MSRSTAPCSLALELQPYLGHAVSLVELRDGVRPHVVAHLLPGLDGSLHQPLQETPHTAVTHNTQSLRLYSKPHSLPLTFNPDPY